MSFFMFIFYIIVLIKTRGEVGTYVLVVVLPHKVGKVKNFRIYPPTTHTKKLPEKIEISKHQQDSRHFVWIFNLF